MDGKNTSRRDAVAMLALGGTALTLAGTVHAGGNGSVCPKLVGRRVRVLGPDSAMTMDYDAERVNIHHDGNFVVTEITIG